VETEFQGTFVLHLIRHLVKIGIVDEVLDQMRD
jgi:hypothetical protein